MIREWIHDLWVRWEENGCCGTNTMLFLFYYPSHVLFKLGDNGCVLSCSGPVDRLLIVYVYPKYLYFSVADMSTRNNWEAVYKVLMFIFHRFQVHPARINSDVFIDSEPMSGAK